MKTQLRKDKPNTVQIGELIVAAFDNAAQYSTNPRVVSRLATELVVHMLRHVVETTYSETRVVN
jgi:hypothetical protein